MEHPYDVTIVGAGIAGLAAARDLSETGLRTLVLDKGRQVGGRMATRRLQGAAFDTGGREAAFDTGAQFFTAVSPEFKSLVESAAKEGAVTQWYQRPPRRPGEDPLPVWRGSAGMTDLPKWIAAGLHRRETVDFHSSTRVTGIEPTRGGVAVFTEGSDREAIGTGAVILTPPVPQTLNLLPRNLLREIDPGITELQYDPCLALLILLDSSLRDVFNEYGWFRPSGSDSMIAWVADNTWKGLPRTGSKALPRLTIHSTGAAARRLYEDTEAHVIEELAGAFMDLVSPGAREILRRALAEEATNLKKWRYARPLRRWPELSVPIAPGIILAGDTFGGGRVEGAFASGRHAAGRILERNE